MCRSYGVSRRGVRIIKRMNGCTVIMQPYSGYEQGPIRPPSEADSLLIRVTRNCPWNRCTFCPVYKGAGFTLRPVEHVKKDIDTILKYVETVRRLSGDAGSLLRNVIYPIAAECGQEELPALYAAFNWYKTGAMKSVFLQDADSLIIKPFRLAAIIKHLKKCFPSIGRITSYARSRTIARIHDDDLQALKEAGLTRLHIGLESGSDTVLAQVGKGVTKETHITAGLKVKRAGIELSEYYIPGLGGTALYEENARESADALNQINPDFIRLRTLAIPENTPLFHEYKTGSFKKCTDIIVVNEILAFIENLDGITSTIASDHILNLFPELEGTLPRDKSRMLRIVRTFLSLEPERQKLFQVGRRRGIFSCLNDMNNPFRRAKSERICESLGITQENVDAITDGFMRRFI